MIQSNQDSGIYALFCGEKIVSENKCVLVTSSNYNARKRLMNAHEILGKDSRYNAVDISDFLAEGKFSDMTVIKLEEVEEIL